MHDFQAWKKYPQHHNWFNKLWLSELLEYNCGPCGTCPDVAGKYIVRPIYNLSGMGVGSAIKYLTPNNVSLIPPGYFWCEVFEGAQYSVTYTFIHDVNPYWKPIKCWEGIRSSDEMFRFERWKRSYHYPAVPRVLNELSDVNLINVEFIGDKVIEVHLRDTPDPEYDEIIPIWEDTQKDIDKYLKMGYTYQNSYEDADGFLETPRLGFMIK